MSKKTLNESRRAEITKDCKALSNFLAPMTRAEKTVAINRICEGCYVPRHTVWNWINHLSRIPELHKRKIEEIFSISIFDDTTI